jgi:YesN/AraC family two-component response regulator
LNDSQNPADRKELEAMLTRLKGELESQKSAEQEWAAKDAEATQELRSEEAKLSALQDQFDQLDKILEQSSRPPASTAERP